MTGPAPRYRTSLRERLIDLGAPGLINLVLLVLYPIAWIAPLARAGVLPFFSGDEITVAGGVVDLWDADAALAILVAFFAVLVPYAKTLALAAIHLRYLRERALPVIEVAGEPFEAAGDVEEVAFGAVAG